MSEFIEGLILYAVTGSPRPSSAVRALPLKTKCARAEELSKRLARVRHHTGGSSGVMQAANKACLSGGVSVGLNINCRTCRHTTHTLRKNPVLTISLCGKVMLTYASGYLFSWRIRDADEFFEIVTLVQTKIKKSQLCCSVKNIGNRCLLLLKINFIGNTAQ